MVQRTVDVHWTTFLSTAHHWQSAGRHFYRLLTAGSRYHVIERTPSSSSAPPSFLDPVERGTGRKGHTRSTGDMYAWFAKFRKGGRTTTHAIQISAVVRTFAVGQPTGPLTNGPQPCGFRPVPRSVYRDSKKSARLP